MLYIVPTPIGNLDDITIRGLKVLQKAKVILCEDPRVTVKLLELLKVENKPKLVQLERNHQFNLKEIYKILKELKNTPSEGVNPQGSRLYSESKTTHEENPFPKGSNQNGLGDHKNGKFSKNTPFEGVKSETSGLLSETISKNGDTGVTSTNFYVQNNLKLDDDENVIALVSDAGTPGISDPAYEVLKIAQSLGLNYTTLPGATALIPAVVNSNLVNKEFLFLGFLPLKKGRQTEWKRIAVSQTPVVIYESCHRIKKFLEEAVSYLSPETKICINQEISKSHENIWVGKISEISNYNLVEKGEFVVVVRG